ncbi:MAG: LemA family protein [candidate division WS2 bacterium ADurb.Bin280]|uniref:LemA family protein n=1 Tax=candidate division WS2 bacterium ADurb.Bin280 TaxID=1852829 RepID=A0A1V5SCL2_9BACT|nr:MAG: LemA family protein [candidate division WS2 bacterium ADurb.Bin280]
MVIFYIVIAVVVLALFYVVATYNGLITLKTRTEESWSDIDVQLKRRYDLIPNLVNTVKSYAKHEKELFEKVTQARAAAIDAKGAKQQGEAETELSKTLKSIFAVAENYPDLKASQNFLSLQGELSDTENKIEAARRFYNANVRDLNIKIKTFPSNIIANSFKFEPKDLFEIEESQKEAVKEPPKVEV